MVPRPDRIPALFVPWLVVLIVLPFVGIVVAIATLIEPAWIGSPISPYVLAAIPVAVVGIVLSLAA